MDESKKYMTKSKIIIIGWFAFTLSTLLLSFDVLDNNNFKKYDIKKGILVYKIESLNKSFDAYTCYIYFSEYGAMEEIYILTDSSGNFYYKYDSIQIKNDELTMLKRRRETNFILEKFVRKKESSLYTGLTVNKCVTVVLKKTKLECEKCIDTSFDDFHTFEGTVIYYKNIPIQARLAKYNMYINLIKYKFFE